RHFYGLRRFNKGKDRPYGAVVGVLQTVLQMIENGDTYLGVATDHVIESFRNRLWADYKTGAGIEPALLAQFHPLEEALAVVGDAADGYPGIAGIGPRTAAELLNNYGPIENFPPNVLGTQRKLALLFKKLATLQTDAPLFKKVETLRWRGPTPAFAKWAKKMDAPRLLERVEKAWKRK